MICAAPGGLRFLRDVVAVRAIPLEPDSIHFPAGDGPGRAVFRRRVRPRQGRLKHASVSRTTAAIALVNRPDEPLRDLLGQDVGRL